MSSVISLVLASDKLCAFRTEYQVKRQDEEKRRLIRERRENGSLEEAIRFLPDLI